MSEDLVNLAQRWPERHATHYDGCEADHVGCLVKKLAQEVERLKAERNEASTGWQPIETAPRDGTKVMIWLVRQKTIAWAQWKDADKGYGFSTNGVRWEWKDGVLVSWVPDHPGAVSHWTTLEPPPTGGHDE